MNRGAIRDLSRMWLNEANEGFHLDADLNTLINFANQKVNRTIVNYDRNFFLVSATFQVTNGNKSWALPTDFWNMVRLEHYNTGDASDIEKIEEIRFPRVEAQGIWPSTKPGKPRRYYIRANQIDFIPIPDATYDLRIYYDNRKNDINLDTDTPSSPDDFHDMIALWAVILALPKNSEGSDEFKQLYFHREEDLLESLMGRDSDDPDFSEAYLEGLL